MLLAQAETDLEILRWKDLAPIVDGALRSITGKELSGFKKWNQWVASEEGRKWLKEHE